MERRTSERIPVNTDAVFYYDGMVYSGTVLNLSEKSMSILTRQCLPIESMFVSFINLKEGAVKIYAKVKRAIKTHGHNQGMGFEILDPAKEYLEYVNKLRRKKEFNLALQVRKETIDHTTKCPRNYLCLTSNNRDMCLIDRPVSDEGLFIKGRVKHENCPYYIEFEYSYICDCPTRHEIYQRYNI
jgi:hypothetical protein